MAIERVFLQSKQSKQSKQSMQSRHRGGASGVPRCVRVPTRGRRRGSEIDCGGANGSRAPEKHEHTSTRAHGKVRVIPRASKFLTPRPPIPHATRFLAPPASRSPAAPTTTSEMRREYSTRSASRSAKIENASATPCALGRQAWRGGGGEGAELGRVEAWTSQSRARKPTRSAALAAGWDGRLMRRQRKGWREVGSATEGMGRDGRAAGELGRVGTGHAVLHGGALGFTDDFGSLLGCDSQPV